MIPDAVVFANPLTDLEFRQRGYVIVPLLDDADITALKSGWAELEPMAPPNPFYVSYFHPDSAFRWRAEQIVLSVLTPRIKNLLIRYTPAFGSFIVKKSEKASAHIPLHQDYSFVDQSVHTAVHMWCPLIDVDEENGCLHFVAGSHASRNYIESISQSPHPCSLVKEQLYRDCSTAVPLKAGTAVFWNGRTLHWSAENKSDQDRVVVSSLWRPEGANIRMHTEDQTNRGQFKVFEIEGYPNFPLGPEMPVTPPFPDNWHAIGFSEMPVYPYSAEEIKNLKVNHPAQIESKGKRWIWRFLRKSWP